MADHTPGHDPLGDRLRGTFIAERDDIERRRSSAPPASSRVGGRSRFMTWAPLAVAAVAIVLAGFFFVNRSNDQAVDLDVAAQPQDSDSSEQPDESGDGGEPGQSAPPTEGAVVEIANDPGPLPYLSGRDFCGDRFDPTRRFAWAADGGDVPVATEPYVGQDAPLARWIQSGTELELTGGCTAGVAAEDDATWFEIAGDPGVWVRTDFLVTKEEYERLSSEPQPQAPSTTAIELPPAAANACDLEVPPGSTWFVTSIGLDDPDGGLVAHTQAGIEAPVTRVLPLDSVATATGGCTVLPSGSNWLELVNPDGGVDWASGRFLSRGFDACVWGEWYGTRLKNNVAFTHELGEGETLAAVAEDYGVELSELLQANRELIDSIPVGYEIIIPDDRSQTTQLVGLVDGAVVMDGELAAFAPLGSDTYRWYSRDAIRFGSCYQSGRAAGPVCLIGSVRLIDFASPEVTFSSETPVEAMRTGRVTSVSSHDFVEVTIDPGDGTFRIGLIDPTRTGIAAAPCSEDPAVQDSLALRPCAIDATTARESSGTAGSSDSLADHVHSLRIEDGPDCMRVVIGLGTGGWTDTDGPAEVVPEVTVIKTAESTTVRFPACDRSDPSCRGFSSGEREPQRVNAGDASVFIAVDGEFQPYVNFVHPPGLSSVTLLESPARLVIDWRPDGPPNANADPLPLRRVILPGGADSVRPGLVVQGFARPFETVGTWHVFEADTNGDTGDPAIAVASGFYTTTSWTEGWGEFNVELPDVPDGDYLIAFGEAPASGDGSFMGSGVAVTVQDGATTTNLIVNLLELTEPIG